MKAVGGGRVGELQKEERETDQNMTRDSESHPGPSRLMRTLAVHVKVDILQFCTEKATKQRARSGSS